MPPGKANAAGQLPLSLLGDARVLVVPVGEMEDFDKASGLEGGAWVSDVLENGKHETCVAARDLLKPPLDPEEAGSKPLADAAPRGPIDLK